LLGTAKINPVFFRPTMTPTPSQPNPGKPDLGLYQTKYLLRNILRNIPGLPLLSPNLLSILAFLPGLVVAICLYQGWWWGAVVAIAGRMFINTLDGLVAEEFNKTSPLGAYLNRLPGEFTDLLIIVALWPHSQPVWVVALLLLTSWVQMFGLLGLVAGGKTQSVGPCGQTDRLAILALAAAGAGCGLPVWPYIIPGLCVGCVLTLGLRIFRSIIEIRAFSAPNP
jgi:CDP-diacylglycerol---glycerol-3-phosphate 3-phosphatidyltransferase